MFRRRRFRSLKIRKQRRQRRIRLAVLWLILIALLIVLAAQITAVPALQILHVDVTGNEALKRQDIFAVVQEKLDGKYLFFFPRRNLFLYPRLSIEESLLKQFPRIARVATDATDEQVLRVVVTEREPAGVVCADIGIEQCNFVDSKGFVFAPAPVFSGSTRFEYKEAGRRVVSVGHRFLDQRTFTLLEELKGALVELGLSPVALTADVTNKDTFARHFTFTLEEGTDTIFNVELEKFVREVQNLQAILISPEFAAETGGNIGVVEYFDLRFGNKVFYRLAPSS